MDKNSRGRTYGLAHRVASHIRTRLRSWLARHAPIDPPWSDSSNLDHRDGLR